MTKKSKTKTKKVESASAFIHGRREITGKGDNAGTVTSVKFDKILGNLSKLGVKIVSMYSNPDIGKDVAGFRVTVTPVTQAEIDEAMSLIFS